MPTNPRLLKRICRAIQWTPPESRAPLSFYCISAKAFEWNFLRKDYGDIDEEDIFELLDEIVIQAAGWKFEESEREWVQWLMEFLLPHCLCTYLESFKEEPGGWNTDLLMEVLVELDVLQQARYLSGEKVFQLFSSMSLWAQRREAREGRHYPWEIDLWTLGILGSGDWFTEELERLCSSSMDEYQVRRRQFLGALFASDEDDFGRRFLTDSRGTARGPTAKSHWHRCNLFNLYVNSDAECERFIESSKDFAPVSHRRNLDRLMGELTLTPLGRRIAKVPEWYPKEGKVQESLLDPTGCTLFVPRRFLD